MWRLQAGWSKRKAKVSRKIFEDDDDETDRKLEHMDSNKNR